MHQPETDGEHPQPRSVVEGYEVIEEGLHFGGWTVGLPDPPRPEPLHVPPDPARGGPLDIYAFRNDHFFAGPAFRDAVAQAWEADVRDGVDHPTVTSLCGGRSIDLRVTPKRSVPHFLTIIWDAGWREPTPLDRLPNQPPGEGEWNISGIPGHPVTVLGVACGNCHRVFASSYEVEDVQQALYDIVDDDTSPPVDERDVGADTPVERET